MKFTILFSIIMLFLCYFMSRTSVSGSQPGTQSKISTQNNLLESENTKTRHLSPGHVPKNIRLTYRERNDALTERLVAHQSKSSNITTNIFTDTTSRDNCTAVLDNFHATEIKLWPSECNPKNNSAPYDSLRKIIEGECPIKYKLFYMYKLLDAFRFNYHLAGKDLNQIKTLPGYPPVSEKGLDMLIDHLKLLLEIELADLNVSEEAHFQYFAMVRLDGGLRFFKAIYGSQAENQK